MQLSKEGKPIKKELHLLGDFLTFLFSSFKLCKTKQGRNLTTITAKRYASKPLGEVITKAQRRNKSVTDSPTSFQFSLNVRLMKIDSSFAIISTGDTYIYIFKIITTLCNRLTYTNLNAVRCGEM